MSRTTNLSNKPPLGKTYLCAIMYGRAIPSLAALKQIAKPLGLDPFDLVAALFGKGA